MKSYPPFLVPEELSSKTPEEWTRAEARRYFDWLTENVSHRVQGLLEYFDIEKTALGATVDRVEGILVEVGHRTIDVAQDDYFYNREADQLTDRGHALGADAGLLVAHFLLRFREGLTWEIVKSPKSDISFNRPVISGFPIYKLDPVNGGVGELYGVCRGRKKEDVWFNSYEAWLNM